MARATPPPLRSLSTRSLQRPALPHRRRAAPRPAEQDDPPEEHRTSLVTAALGERLVEPACAAEGCIATTLADVDPGGRATVLDVCTGTDPAVARRLLDLALAPGAVVEVVRRALMADPIVLRVAGYDIALRRAQAAAVRVAAA